MDFFVFQDPRFNSEIDLRTGYKTHSILCMPICNYEGDVIGVAQIINKTNDSQEFTTHDVEVFQRYLTFCGIGLQNAQLFEVSVLEYKRNQVIHSSSATLSAPLICTFAVADIAKFSSEHIRRTKQSGVPGHEDNEGGAGLAKMRKMRRLFAGSGLLRSGKYFHFHLR